MKENIQEKIHIFWIYWTHFLRPLSLRLALPGMHLMAQDSTALKPLSPWTVKAVGWKARAPPLSLKFHQSLSSKFHQSLSSKFHQSLSSSQAQNLKSHKSPPWKSLPRRLHSCSILCCDLVVFLGSLLPGYLPLQSCKTYERHWRWNRNDQ